MSYLTKNFVIAMLLGALTITTYFGASQLKNSQRLYQVAGEFAAQYLMCVRRELDKQFEGFDI